MKSIGFIGAGAMGEAIIKGLLKKGIQPEKIIFSDKNTERCEYIKKEYEIFCAKDNCEITEIADIIILAVKPQQLESTLEDISKKIPVKTLLISIAAGKRISMIEDMLPPGSKVIRAMPNTPALIGQGTTAIAGGSFVDVNDINEAANIFKAIGSVSILPEELFNAVTGLSGSGPAFIYLIIEALADGGVLAGLPRDIAYKLAAETVKGSAMMVMETKMHPGQLKDMVTSPAGTTIEGILCMEKAGLRGVLMDTVLNAALKSEKMQSS